MAPISFGKLYFEHNNLLDRLYSYIICESHVVPRFPHVACGWTYVSPTPIPNVGFGHLGALVVGEHGPQQFRAIAKTALVGVFGLPHWIHLRIYKLFWLVPDSNSTYLDPVCILAPGDHRLRDR